MTTGGVFNLLVNDGKVDRMLLATKLLYQRIQDIMFMRTKTGRDDATPSLIDLERTHIIYVNAHFKPFAAIGFEYNKVMPQGQAQFGDSVTFSIPQFGDFFNDMVCRVRIDQASGKIGIVPVQSTNPNQLTNIYPANNGNFSYNIVDTAGNIIPDGSTYRNFVRYCEYPGNRLFKRVTFDVNGNPLDEYDTNATCMLEKFTVAPNKRFGYNNLVGQQNVLHGVGNLSANKVNDADNSNPGFSQSAPFGNAVSTNNQVFNTPSNITPFTLGQSNNTACVFNPSSSSLTYNHNPAFNDVNGNAPLSLSLGNTLSNAPVNTFPNSNTNSNHFDYNISQKVGSYVNGPQTPKPVQQPLEIWNKLRFWFNDDVSLSIPSVSIPYGQRFITIYLEEMGNLLYESPSIYLASKNRISVSSLDTIATDIYFNIDTNNVVHLKFFNRGTLIYTCNIGIWNSNTILDNADYHAQDIGIINGGTMLTMGPGDGPHVNVPFSQAVSASTTTYNSEYLHPSTSTILLGSPASLPDSTTHTTTTITSNVTGHYITILMQNYVDFYEYQQDSEYKTYSPIYQYNGISDAKIVLMELYVNNIFVNPEIHDIFIRRIGFALIRVYRQQKNIVNTAETKQLLNSLKWPIEYMFVGIQPMFNNKCPTASGGFLTGGNVNIWRDWHRMTRQIEATEDNYQIAETSNSGSYVGHVDPMKYFVPVSTVDSISLTSHGIMLYDTFSDTFFNSYSTIRYGDENINTPEDTGAFFINFSLFPRKYQPGGYLNMSRSRETYINLVSSYATMKTPCMLIIVAIAINFILISDGSAVLRYST